MLRNSHKLYMGVFHLFQIFHDPVGELTIIIESFRSAVIRMLHERTDMALIDCHGLLVHIFLSRASIHLESFQSNPVISVTMDAVPGLYSA